MYFFHLRLVAKDKSGAEFPIAFHLDDEAELDINRFQVSHTIAILYLNQHGFLDMTA
jgi:hypothetical protein